MHFKDIKKISPGLFKILIYFQINFITSALINLNKSNRNSGNLVLPKLTQNKITVKNYALKFKTIAIIKSSNFKKNYKITNSKTKS